MTPDGAVIRPFSPKRIIAVFLRNWIDFLPAGAVTFAALWVAPKVYQDFFVWVFASGFYVHAAANALAENPSEREWFNSNRLETHFKSLLFPVVMAVLLALPVMAVPGYFASRQLWYWVVFSFITIITILLWILSRLWPAYVTPWLFRDDEKLDAWRDRSNFNPLILDWKVARLLLGVAGAGRAATTPVIAAPILTLGIWAAAAVAASENQTARILLELLLVFVLVPMMQLNVMERAKALRDAAKNEVETAIQESIRKKQAAVAAEHKRKQARTAQRQIDKDLQTACARGDLDKVLELLKAGADPNRWTPGNEPLLHAHLHDHSITKALLQHGVDPRQTDDLGRTTLHIAAIGGGRETINMLLRAGVDPQIRDAEGLTPFDYAARYRAETDILETLSSPAGDKDPGQQLTILMAAIQKGDRQKVALCLKKPILSTKEANGIIHTAAAADDPAILRMLIDAGLSVNQADRIGDYPLHSAVREGNDRAAALLIEKGARPDATNKEGYLPIHVAIRSERCPRQIKRKIVRILLAAGSPNTARLKNGETLRSDARKQGLDELLDLLPAEVNEPPIDFSARGINSLELYRDPQTRIIYTPNDIRHPFTVSEYLGRDGWWPHPYGPQRFDELRRILSEYQLEWMQPVVDSWLDNRPIFFEKVLSLCRDHMDDAPKIRYFQ